MGAGINIAWVALLENGKEIARDTHPGCARADHRMVGSYDSLYVLTAAGRKPGGKYTLQASVTPEGGTDSAGEVKFDGPMRRPLW
jgi:hexosaminidase